MRSWKKAKNASQKIFLYFRAHPEIFFSSAHVSTQTGIGINQTRRIVRSFEKLQKVQSADVVTSLPWGRPRRVYRATRTTQDALAQLEIFQDALATQEAYDMVDNRRGRL